MQITDVPHVSLAARLRYLQRRIEDIALCFEKIAAADFATIQNLAHRMKGNGATFGFPEISDFGAILENSAITQNSEEATALLKQMQERVRVLLDSMGPLEGGGLLGQPN